MNYKYNFGIYIVLSLMSTSSLHANGKEEVDVEEDIEIVHVATPSKSNLDLMPTVEGDASLLDTLPQPILEKIISQLETDDKLGDLSNFAAIYKAGQKATKLACYNHMMKTGVVKVSDKNLLPTLADMLSNDDAPEDFKSLEIDIADNGLIDADLIHLTNATNINLKYLCKIIGEGMKCFTNAKTVNLYFCTKVTDEALRNLTEVTNINLAFCWGITNAGLKHLTKATIVNLEGCNQITDEGLEHLSEATNINLKSCNEITNAGLKHLGKAIILNLNDCDNITDAGLENLTKVKVLNLKDCDRITNNGLKHLANATMVNLSGCYKITDEGLNHLTKVEVLNLKNCDSISEPAKQALRERGVEVID